MEKNERVRIVKDVCGGIQPQFQEFYLVSIMGVCSSALNAFAKYDSLIEQNNPPLLTTALQEALVHTSALSRFFWPSRSKEGLSEKRGENLRKLFELDSNSPLADRSLRNALEHFDERLDEYLLWLEAGYIFPTSHIGDATLADEEIGHFFRLVDPVSSCFVLFGQKYWFLELRKEVEFVFNKLSALNGA